jgi:hypothetical protein
VDLSKFKTSDWLKVGGGALMFIAYFLNWWQFDEAGLSSFGFKGSNYFFTGTIPWLLLLAIGVLTFLGAAGIFKLPATLPAPLIFLAASAVSLLFLLLRFFGPGHGAPSNSGLSRGIGLFLALIAGILVLVGSVLGFKESGGDLNDLKDMNKLKSSFGGGSAGGAGSPPPPPPPPPGMSPPPPPPPPPPPAG